MATYTENLNLEKPDLDDFYDVNKRNDNYDKIDEAIGKLDDDMKDHKTDPDTHANLKHYVKKAGDTMTGALIVSTGDNKNITLNDGNIKMTGVSIAKSTNDNVLSFNGGVDTLNGSTLFVYGKDTVQTGKFRLRANNGETYKDLEGTPNGSLTWNNKNIVRSVNGVNADDNGNTDVTKLKSINLGDFTENQEVTTLDTTEGNCVLVGNGGKSHNSNFYGLDWAFLQVQNSEKEKTYQKFQLGTGDARELMYRVSDADDTDWYDWLQVSLIAEQGSDYIRYNNGIQICWGKLSITSSGKSWGNLYDSNSIYQNYPKSFKSAPIVTAGSNGDAYCMIESAGGNNVRTPNFLAVKPLNFTNQNFIISYIAIGLWK